MIDICKECGSNEIETEPLRGDVICTSCGTILEDVNIVVHEVQFEESDKGSAQIGSFFSADALSKKACNVLRHGKQDAKEQTLRRARQRITDVCNRLNLKRERVESAIELYGMAAEKYFTKGRKYQYTVGACIYLASRLCKKFPCNVMLLDISDALKINIVDLGRTYLKLKQKLSMKLPAIDPCWYVWRFAGKLSFGDKCHDVGETALRLISRMKKDNLHVGRRPSGLCGAAIIIAARLHNFNRTIHDIVKVVQVHQSTLWKRLKEFGDTESSSLTKEELLDDDGKLESFQEADPPSFIENRRKEQEQLINNELKQLKNKEKDIDEELEEIKKEIDIYLRDKKSKGIFTIKSKDEDFQAQEFINRNTIEAIDNLIEDEEIEDIPIINMNLRPSLKSLGIENIIPPTETEENTNDSEPQDLSLDGIDDDEIDSYILTNQEMKLKSKIWTNANEDYLREQEEKREREKELEKLAEGEPPKKKKKYTRKTHIGPSSTAEEAINKIVEQKKISKKLASITESFNYSNTSTIESLLSKESIHPQMDKLFSEITGNKNPFINEEVESDSENVNADMTYSDEEIEDDDDGDGDDNNKHSIHNLIASNFDNNDEVSGDPEPYDEDFDYEDY